MMVWMKTRDQRGLCAQCVHRKGLWGAKSRCLHKAWSQHNDHIDHHTMITLFTPKWRLWSQLQAYQLDRHTPQSIWSRLQPNYQMTTSWWSTCCPHHPSLVCASKSNLGWPHLTQVLGAASQPHLPQYRYLCTWQPCRCCSVTCIALNGVWLANPLSIHYFQLLSFVFFSS